MFVEKIYLKKEKEQLNTSFGFKGNKLTYLLQVSVTVKDGGFTGVGVGVQSALWSDAKVYGEFGENKSNELMFNLTRYAASLLKGLEFSTPEQAFDFLFPKVFEYAKNTVKWDVSETFVLNSLVPIDFALWMLYANECGITSFDGIFNTGKKADALANIPLITYETPLSDIVKMAKEGTPLFKIKIGSNPDGDGDPQKMLEWDEKRALEIHTALMEVVTPYTDTGHILYYFDANGRYDTKERLKALTDFFKETGILDRVILFEEPFAEKNETDVSDIPVTFALDESIHNLEDAKRKIKLGYKALTLKPVAKTLTLSMRMARLAHEVGVECFTADLTVNPVMLEWNKNFAARLSPLKKMKIGVVESNGKQNYSDWERLKSYLPKKTIHDSESFYFLDRDFYENPVVFTPPTHYLSEEAEK